MTAEQLAQALGAVRSGRQWKCRCVAHEDRSPSMIIFDGHESVQVRCMAGCAPEDIIAVLRSRGLWVGLDECERDRSDLERKSISRETLREDRREHMLRTLARCIFDDAQPLQGTIAQRYFESRDLWSVAMEIDDIRFHPSCPREKGQQPAVVVAMRSISSRAVTAVQRIFLDRQGRKQGKGMMLGSAGGAAMQLQPKIGSTLHIGEGLETSLACIAMDRAPCWALGSTSLIQTFPVLADIERLVIWADHDPLQKIGGVWCRPGHKAAGVCADRWLKAGKQVEVETPRQEGWDEADVWSARCARI
jgi:putative DNA primase/helicase